MRLQSVGRQRESAIRIGEPQLIVAFGLVQYILNVQRGMSEKRPQCTLGQGSRVGHRQSFVWRLAVSQGSAQHLDGFASR